MATETATPALKIEKKDFKVFVTLDAKGKIDEAKVVSTENQVKSTTEAKVKDSDGNSVAKYQLGLEQSVKWIIPGTEEGFQAAIPDADARLDIIRRGFANKQTQVIRQEFTKLTEAEDNLAYEPVEGDFDPLPYMQEGPKRVKLTENEKLLRVLQSMNLPDAVIQTMLAQATASKAEVDSEDSEKELAEVNS